jgi:hypothetical protein
MGKWIVFDEKGIIHSSDDYDAALKEFNETEEFQGDLRLVEQHEIRR